MPEKNIHNILQKIFKLQEFREGQQEIIQSVIDGNDTLVYMPTWWGKSLVYQLPTLVRNGITLVISPLISLMKDQVDKLNYLGIRAELINSTISSSEIKNILEEVEFANTSRNPIRFLYIAPERLGSRLFTRAIQNTRIAMVAIDEAHCISQWGHDFRPSYMKIKWFIESLHGIELRSFPIVALTATATQKVREDIKERLGISQYQEFIKGFDRKNIVIVVREISAKEEKQKKVLDILNKTPGVGIVYCSSRKNVVELTEYLQKKWLNIGSYKWDMSPEIREQEQNKFMNDEYKAIVATNAFGMGIDKSDIRFVIHYNLPGSIENYYQEVGRAGRDGKKSFWVVLASYGDTKIQEFFIDNIYPSKAEILKLYDTLYRGISLWKGQDSIIQKTYYALSSESGIDSDMKVWSAIKILEKYGVLHRGIDTSEVQEDFRGRGVTLIQEKRNHSHVLVDWSRQDNLKQEAYYKLEQIKKLLFHPSCRKKFILDYFGDREDLEQLWDNCGLCDFCLEKQNLEIEDIEKLIPTSMYQIVLETVQKYNEKFGATLLWKVLTGSGEKRITERNLDLYEHYNVFFEYSLECIIAIFEALVQEWFLYKTSGKYPVIGLSEVGITTLRKWKYLQESLKDLNTFVAMQVGTEIFKKQKKAPWAPKKSQPRGETYKETLELLLSWKTLKEISLSRWLWLQTIENHVIKLYESWQYSLLKILDLVDLDQLKKVKEALESDAILQATELKPIKEKLESLWYTDVSYFDIKIALAMIEKGDL